MSERKLAKSRRKGIGLLAVRDPQRALEVDAETRFLLDLRKAEDHIVVFERGHEFPPLPVAVPDLANEAQHGIVGQGTQRANEFPEKLWSRHDGRTKIGGNFAAHR